MCKWCREKEEFDRLMSQPATEANSQCSDGLSANGVVKWLEGEIERFEYPTGSLDVTRADRHIGATRAKMALVSVKKLIDLGR